MDATSTAASNAAFNSPTVDEPYRFGGKPTTAWPFPFTERQFRPPAQRARRIQCAASTADQAEA